MERFKYRYKDTFLWKYGILNQMEPEFLALKEVGREDKHKFGAEIKHTFEFGWKTMKDYLKDKGTKALLPRKIILLMKNEMSIDNWIKMLDDINTYIQTNDESALDIMIMNYFTTYKSTFVEFCRFFDGKMKIAMRPSAKKTQQYSNHSIMDSYCFCLFINYFLKHPKIHYVRIYGSRAGNNYRRASDIDFLVGGNYTAEEFSRYEQELKSLRHPYMLDVTNVNDVDTDKKKAFVEAILPLSIPFFNRLDFE